MKKTNSVREKTPYTGNDTQNCFKYTS